MHPPLALHQHQDCAQVIQALHACHQSSLWAKYTGGCNSLKEELTQCLRAERLERTTKNRDDAAQRRQKTQAVWAAIDAES
ncbi:uncharacterized protein L969DRAFT_95601 [Mixia osmundae IAM 14324]|uniref:COX assembly mitochondrial protein n=1 Tax=Mixia osmundae (strain CBS 9802 / IAM 14324 / JCM 22182 / KY 12970) TaxID=764103 RepID=G7E7W5_MIXOS|nr:uncharacterized protein L969DRAFT_95601 [Mixia osmundae IAM 14324]KEI38526.1 hypothetical protein L969DRAFT_95601 [Mixia osmundae IAM 14324]GAA98925.1 hypothetical protein E5Q_05613 [Mixia osmundae IAM 14324]